jgi:hypothetical protein
MSKLQPDSSFYSSNPQHQPSSGTTGSQQLSGRGTSSGPASTYSGFSTGDQSGTGTYSHSQAGYPSSGTVVTPVGNAPSSRGASPFYTPNAMGPQPGSGGTYAPPSSMIGAGGYMSSNSGATLPGMQPAMYTSSNAAYSGGMVSQHMNGMYAASMTPAAASYPTMGPVGSQPLPAHGMISSMGPVMGPHGMMMPGMDPAAAQEEARRLAGGRGRSWVACAQKQGRRALHIHDSSACARLLGAA